MCCRACRLRRAGPNSSACSADASARPPSSIPSSASRHSARQDLLQGRRHYHRQLLVRHSPASGWCSTGRPVFPTLSVEDNLLVAGHSPERHGWGLQRVYALFPRLREREARAPRGCPAASRESTPSAARWSARSRSLIMDEPSEGLAPIIIQGLWRTIAKLKLEGLSMLLVGGDAALGAQAGRLRARDLEGQGGLFGTAGRAVGRPRRQIAVPWHIGAIASRSSPPQSCCSNCCAGSA